MIDKIKNICFYLVFGFIIVIVSYFLKSAFIIDFLSKNLITILIALLAINTTTGSVVMTKLKEITDKTQVDFSSTIAELKLSILEQIWHIILALIISILCSSKLILDIHFSVKGILGGLLASIFVASLHNLYDTANSIFIILDSENNR